MLSGIARMIFEKRQSWQHTPWACCGGLKALLQWDHSTALIRESGKLTLAFDEHTKEGQIFASHSLQTALLKYAVFRMSDLPAVVYQLYAFIVIHSNSGLSMSFESVCGHPPSPPLDNIRVMVIVWRLRGNIIRTALCWIVWHNVHSQQPVSYTHLTLTTILRV